MLWGISFFNYADRQAIFSVFPLLAKELDLSPSQLGLLGSSFAWVYGLCAPFAGNIVDRMRRVTAILGGLYAWSLICAATALARTFPHLVMFRAAEGLGETFYFPASMSLLSDYHGVKTRSRAMGLHQTSVYVGTIAGGAFAGLIGQYYGWRLSFVVFGGLGILLGLILKRYLREPERGAADLADAGVPAHGTIKMPLMDFVRVIWGTPTLLLLLGAFVCSNFVAMVMLSWMPKFLYDKFQLSLTMAGLTATLFAQVGSMCGAPLGGWLADRMRARRPGGRMMVQAAAVLLGAPFVMLCGATQSVLILTLTLFAWGFFKGLYDANIFASVYDVVRPEARGTAAGFMNMVGWLLGGASAPLLIGYLSERSSLSYAISLTAIVYIAAGTLLTIAVFFTAKRDVTRMEKELLNSNG
jgi:MFS family permease